MEEYVLYNSNGDEVDITYGAPRYFNIKSAKCAELPRLYMSKKDCCGCSACFAVCPMSRDENVDTVMIKGIGKTQLTGAITLIPDEKGFLYPVIDAALCVGCHRCETICSFK